MKLEDVSFEVRAEIAAHYLGSTMTVADWVLSGRDFIAEEDVQSILGDQEVEECTVCGWWSEMAEMDDSTGELVCAGCVEQPDEDD